MGAPESSKNGIGQAVELLRFLDVLSSCVLGGRVAYMNVSLDSWLLILATPPGPPHPERWVLDMDVMTPCLSKNHAQSFADAVGDEVGYKPRHRGYTQWCPYSHMPLTGHWISPISHCTGFALYKGGYTGTLNE